MGNKQTRQLVLSALFLSLALVLPFLTGQIPEVGKMLCPMHLPVLLCGFFCSWPWGLAVGVVAPLLRSALFGMPQLFPTAVCMSIELATYGAVSALMYRQLKGRRGGVYISLLTAMIAGRLAWGAAQLVCVGLDVSAFGISAFWAGAVTTALPGIAVQLVLIPALVVLLEKYTAIPVCK